MSALYRIVYSLKNSKFNKKINEFFNVLSTQKISIASISFDIAYKELKIVEIAHINQLFFHSDASVGKSYAKEENVNNDVSKDSPSDAHGGQVLSFNI